MRAPVRFSIDKLVENNAHEMQRLPPVLVLLLSLPHIDFQTFHIVLKMRLLCVGDLTHLDNTRNLIKFLALLPFILFMTLLSIFQEPLLQYSTLKV